MTYLCKDCDAYVGCHNNTREALGTMADYELRQERKKTHAVLDPLWKTKSKKYRKRVYYTLKKHFGREIHVGGSDVEQCKQIQRFLSDPKLQILKFK